MTTTELTRPADTSMMRIVHDALRRDGDALAYRQIAPAKGTRVQRALEALHPFADAGFIGRRKRQAQRGRVEHEIAHAQAMGSQVVHWNTRAGNDPARALYDRIATLSDRVIYLLSVAPAD